MNAVSDSVEVTIGYKIQNPVVSALCSLQVFFCNYWIKGVTLHKTI